MNIMKKRPHLDEVLSYQNSDIIEGFRKDFSISLEAASDIFEQVKCMLWLCNELSAENNDSKNVVFRMDDSLRVLDEMWHTFILFTREYTAFCLDKFGYYLHHMPTVSGGEEAKLRTDYYQSLSPDECVAAIIQEKRVQYIIVYKKLGKDRFIKWYVEYHKMYPERHLLDLKIKAFEERSNSRTPATLSGA